MIDIVTGSGAWAHYPALVLLTVFLLMAAPVWSRGRINATYLRLGVLTVGLVLINLFTWSGSFWAIWPVGALVFAELMRQASKRQN